MIAPPFSTEAPLPRPGDSDLLRALEAGDRSAGEELVRRSYPMIFKSLLRLCGGDKETASDLTQESYRRAWAALKSFDGRSHFSTWLYQIAYRSFLNHVRRPRKVIPFDEPVTRRLESESPDPEEAATSAEQEEQLRRAILKLPKALGETITARYWGEIPVRELALIGGISEVAVRKRIRKALALLRDHLEVTS